VITTLLQLAALFGMLSLLAVGGGNGVIPEMQHYAVDVHHWMSNQQFLDVFAISRAAPGPGSLIVVLVGEKAAGVAGALVAAIAMYTPSCSLVYLAARVWRRFEQAPWRQHAERALAPVAVGLTFGSGLAIARATEHGWLGWAMTGASTVILAVTEINPLIVLGGCAALALIVTGLG
jgi:chromate transporter